VKGKSAYLSTQQLIMRRYSLSIEGIKETTSKEQDETRERKSTLRDGKTAPSTKPGPLLRSITRERCKRKKREEGV